MQVVVHIDQAILSEQQAAAEDGPHCCELEEGPALPLDTARRLACDATVIRLVEGTDGEPLDIGRKTRSIPAAIGRALKARDGGCRYPGCDRTRVEENGSHCFRGNISPSAQPAHAGFDESLRDYLKKHEPGLSITSDTSRCQWHGESMDYSHAIESMQFLEHKAAVPERLAAG